MPPKNFKKQLRNERLKLANEQLARYKMWNETYLKEFQRLKAENDALKREVEVLKKKCATN